MGSGNDTGLSGGMSMGRDRTHNGATSTYLGDDAGRRPGMLDQLMSDYRTTYSGANNNANKLLGGGNNSQIGNNSGYEQAGYDWNPDTNSNFASYGGTGPDPSITDPARQSRINYGPGGAPASAATTGGGGTTPGGGGDSPVGPPSAPDNPNPDSPGPGGTDWGKEPSGYDTAGSAGPGEGDADPVNPTSGPGGPTAPGTTGGTGSTDASQPGLMDYGTSQMFNPENANDQQVRTGWQDFAGPSADETATNDAWKQYASGPTSAESGLISSSQKLADASDPRLAAASAAKTNVADTTGDQYLGGKYKGMVEHGGLTPEQGAALRTSADLAARSASDTARADIGRTIAKRGNAAGAYAALSKVGADASQSAGERERQNVLDMASLARQDKTAGLAGLGDVSGREQGKNLSQAQIDASRNAQNASLADAGSNRTLSATTSGLGALGNALNAQRGYTATGITGTAASNNAAAAKQQAALTAAQAQNKDITAKSQFGATLNKGLYDSESQKQLAAMNAEAGLGTKPRELYTDGTSTSGNGGLSI